MLSAWRRRCLDRFVCSKSHITFCWFLLTRRLSVGGVHDPHRARRLLQLHAVQIAYADGGQRLPLLLLLDGGQRCGQLGGFGPVRRRVAGRSGRRRVAADALQVLGWLDEPAVVGAGCRELGRNERGRRLLLLLLLRSRGARRPTATVGHGVVICRNKTRVVTLSPMVAGGRRRAKPLPGQVPGTDAGRAPRRDNWAKARAKSERGRSRTSDFFLN